MQLSEGITFGRRSQQRVETLGDTSGSNMRKKELPRSYRTEFPEDFPMLIITLETVAWCECYHSLLNYSADGHLRWFQVSFITNHTNSFSKLYLFSVLLSCLLTGDPT
jgi:hypothetical protein